MGRQNIVMVEKDTYDAMVNAFNRVKNERFRNTQVSASLGKSLETLDHEIDSLGAKIAEVQNYVTITKEAASTIPDDYSGLRAKITSNVDTVEYNLMESGDKIHKLLAGIKNMKLIMKPLEDYKE